MARTIPAPNAPPKARDQFWLDHLRACREQGQTLKAYARAQGLSVSTLYGARSALKRRGMLAEPACASSPRGPAPTAPTFVPVRIPTAGAAFRVRIPVQADHRFRCNPITDSGPKPITFRRGPESRGSSDMKESATRDIPLR